MCRKANRKSQNFSLFVKNGEKSTKCIQSSLYRLPHDITNKTACAPSEDSDQTGHLPSLIRVFAGCSIGS